MDLVVNEAAGSSAALVDGIPEIMRPMEAFDFTAAIILALFIPAALGWIASKSSLLIRGLIFLFTTFGIIAAMAMVNGIEVLWFFPVRAQQWAIISLSWLPFTWVFSDIFRKRAAKARFVRQPTDVDKEQIKLTAQALDRASTTCFAVGVAGPAAAYFWNTPASLTAMTTWEVAVLLVSWLAVAISLHLFARRVLKGLP